jgi:hypothetical protein
VANARPGLAEGAFHFVEPDKDAEHRAGQRFDYPAAITREVFNFGLRVGEVWRGHGRENDGPPRPRAVKSRRARAVALPASNVGFFGLQMPKKAFCFQYGA